MRPAVHLLVLTTSELDRDLLTQLRPLLDAAFEGDFSETDWTHACGGHHVLALEEDRILAHAAVVPRRLTAGDRPLRTGYVEAVATVAEARHRGVGSRAMGEIDRLVRTGFELGALATGVHPFYEHLGWERWRGPTYAPGPDGPVRTAEDDDAVMVLRVGPSAGLDLTLPLRCDTRPGSAW